VIPPLTPNPPAETRDEDRRWTGETRTEKGGQTAHQGRD
jgi:hypothetical protein